MGGTQKEALNIWEWAHIFECWLTIPGLENVLADLRSRKFADHLELSLNIDIFQDNCKKNGEPLRSTCLHQD